LVVQLPTTTPKTHLNSRPSIHPSIIIIIIIIIIAPGREVCLIPSSSPFFQSSNHPASFNF